MADDLIATIRRQIRLETESSIAALDRRASAIERRMPDLTLSDDQLYERDDNITARVTDLAATVAGIPIVTMRQVILPMPVLSVGSTPMAVTWTTPMATADYAVMVTCEAGLSVLGRLVGGLQAGSRTLAGCTVVVTNSGLAPIGIGGSVHVLAWSVAQGLR